ncbi:KH domain-containing protein [Peptoniphilus sp.]|uniref:KH domain-containing protein n=1 Tax=Peptoniphilus sp. TaxID=1971214 RepID=UPI003993FD8A
MVELVEFIAKSLCEDKESVKVECETTDSSINITLHVAEADMGKVIGRQGRIAKSIRTILKAMSLKENTKVNLQIEN